VYIFAGIMLVLDVTLGSETFSLFEENVSKLLFNHK